MMIETLTPNAVQDLTMVVVKQLLQAKVDHAIITAVIDGIEQWVDTTEERVQAAYNERIKITAGFFQNSSPSTLVDLK